MRDAQADAASGKCEAAKAKIEQAQGVGGKTADESSTITQMKQYVDVKCGTADSSLGARAKFSQDYAAGRYRAVIDDAPLLKKFGALDSASMLAIAGAYYKLGDYAGCEHYLRDSFGMRGGETALEMLRRCAFEIDDTTTQREALEELVSSTGKAQYWDQLLETARKTQGLKDHQTLDIYRIKFLTGSIRTTDDVKLLAELAIENGDPAEAVNVLQKSNGIAGVAGNARFAKLLATAQAQAAQDAANLAKASASANGDTLVKLGEEQWGAGKPQDTIRLVQAGIAKGVSDKDNAQIRLGMGYLGAGQKEAAIKAFSSAKGDPKWQIVGHLWALYARK